MVALLGTLAALALLGCTAEPQPLAPPREIGTWKLAGEAPVPAASFPDSLQRLEVRSAVRAIYREAGPSAEATVYQMPSATSAFEAVQTYTRHPDEYYFQKGPSFVVLNLKELPLDARRPFLLAFHMAVSPHGPEHPEEPEGPKKN